MSFHVNLRQGTSTRHSGKKGQGRRKHLLGRCLSFGLLPALAGANPTGFRDADCHLSFGQDWGPSSTMVDHTSYGPAIHNADFSSVGPRDILLAPHAGLCQLERDLQYRPSVLQVVSSSGIVSWV